MSADTETIREALDILREVVIDWMRDTRKWKIAPADAEAALAALGRVEERERVLTEALREIAGTATDLPHARRIDRDNMRSIARAALDREFLPRDDPASAGSGEK